MVATTRSKIHLVRRGLVEDNAFANRRLLDIAVPIERALASGLAPNTIDSMNSVIRAARSVIHDRCMMAGGYPTFLLEKTTKFSDVDFVLVVDEQADYYSFYINFARLIEEQLDPDKNWQFETYGHLLSSYDVKVSDVPLSDKSSISLVAKGTKKEYPASSNMQIIKLKADGINVAFFCFFVQSTPFKRVTSSKEMVIDGLVRVGEGYAHKRAINNTYFLTNVAHFNGPDGCLHCHDISEKNNVRCLPIFKKRSKASEKRRLKYRARVSKSFSYLVKELGELVL